MDQHAFKAQLEADGYLRTAHQGGAVTIYEIIAQDRPPAEVAATFLTPRFGVEADPASTTFISPTTFDSPARQ